GGSREVLGRRIVTGERPFTIVGVMPPDVEYPNGVEAWNTLHADAATLTNPAFRVGVLRDLDLFARLRPGVTVAQAAAELRAAGAGREPGALSSGRRAGAGGLALDAGRPDRAPPRPLATAGFGARRRRRVPVHDRGGVPRRLAGRARARAVLGARGRRGASPR